MGGGSQTRDEVCLVIMGGGQRCATGCASPRGPRGWFGPSLNKGLGSSAWMPYCVGRYLDKVPSMYKVMPLDVLRFRSVSGRLCPFRVKRPPWISPADLTSPRAGSNASRALPLRRSRPPSLWHFGSSGTRLPSAHETVAEGSAVSINSANGQH